MKSINPMGTAHPKPGGVPAADKMDMNARKAPAKKGEDPRKSMIDGPYGGKKPQS